MLPNAARYLDSVRKSRGKPVCAAEQRILDAALWLESLTGKPRNRAAIVAALANLPHVQNAADWFRILDKRKLVDFEDLTIKMRALGRTKASAPDSTPTIEALHSRIVRNHDGPHQRTLRALIERFPDSYSRAELATAADIGLGSFCLDHAVRTLFRQRLIQYTENYQLIASDALFPAKAAATEATSSSGIPIRALAPLFGMTPRAMRSAIGAGVFPIPTYLARDRRYADRQVVTDYFAAKNAESSAAVVSTI